MKKTNRAALMIIICMFFWGSVFPIAKILLVDISGASLALYRFVIAVLSLGIYMKLRRITLPHLTLFQWMMLLLVGMFGVGGFNIALFSGLQQTSATNAALIMSLSPIVTSLLSAILSKQWITKKQCISLVISFSGVVLVITNGSMDRLIQLNVNHGDLIIMVAMLAWSSYTICSQKLNTWAATIPYTQITMAAGLFSLLIFSFIQVDSHAWQEVQTLSVIGLVEVLYLGLFSTVIGYLFWIQGVSDLGPAKASIFYNLVPVFAALISLMFGQVLTEVQLTGMAIVLLGLTLPLWFTFFNKVGRVKTV